ncbi:FAD-dependent oxidoreductase [Massilia orientalis]|uniref:FAD-dependent oxidoreductase n=1 Tax=Massilia orientalis TaxID=3050128 RepID=A0ACC7MKD0_9BURK
MSKHIIIAGGGPTGLLTALGLAKQGNRVTVLEAEDKPNESPRALVYHFSVLPYLRDLGILEDCVAAGFLRQDHAWRIHQTGELIRWNLSCLEGTVEFPYALNLGQDKLSRVVLKHLEKYPNVSIRYETSLVGCTDHGSGVTVQLQSRGENEELEGDWLIGADGAGSFVRRQVLKMQFFGVTWPERYVATNLRVDLDSQGFSNTTMQVDPIYGSVICKIDPNNFWRVTFVEDPTLPVESLKQRATEKLSRLLPEGVKFEIDAFSPYRMHQRVADRMRQGRILLVGDAAHVTNPTGGLGLTGGMFDSFALVEALGRVTLDGASDDILEFYDRDRRQKFVELVSPRASHNLRTLYHMLPGQQRDEWIAQARAIAADRDRMREVMSFHDQMRTVF